jgi:hypothetical protein
VKRRATNLGLTVRLEFANTWDLGAPEGRHGQLVYNRLSGGWAIICAFFYNPVEDLDGLLELFAVFQPPQDVDRRPA